jgi:hypothetical protein
MQTLDSAIYSLHQATSDIQLAIRTEPGQCNPFYAGYLLAVVSHLMDLQAKLTSTIKELYPPVGKNLQALCAELRQQKNLP